MKSMERPIKPISIFEILIIVKNEFRLVKPVFTVSAKAENNNSSGGLYLKLQQEVNRLRYLVPVESIS